MEYNEIMIRYAELSTKRKNKKIFINRLVENVKAVLHDFETIKIHSDRNRMYILLNGSDSALIMNRLKLVFGIQSFSPVMKVEKDMEAIKDMAVTMVKEQYTGGQTFKITTHRADHTFEFDTNEVNRILGSEIENKVKGISVNVKQPDIDLRVEIRTESVFLSSQTIKGAGGLPVGSSGKGMLMLSGGIDSPVAGYLAMKKGVEVEVVHFHSPPYTSSRALQKAKDLTSRIASFSGNINFIEVPFTEIQEEIKRTVPEGYLMTVTRRMMMRLTDEIRNQRNSLAIFNGESLGQVASQTLHSMRAINDVTATPILRPVISMDKAEIITIAKSIGTYNLSIQPFEDCCTIFAPSSPKTKPDLEKTRKYEARLDSELLIQNALDNLTISTVSVGQTMEEKERELFSDLL